ncbi:glycosyltransferase family 4 protein [Bradyrhizobium sp. 4]|uniref:glycosyltransferase family 4 protein n=1 Tax=unclassified Bradyrhizobium TaxID=2631580 RepID=UPI001FF9FEE4|nr:MULTISPECIES: glycosyltransferase family 4 protein [unclassified Bradyrhizobium]MCK1397442.1 glycosyltransferase family 4 protein [Bradyrhizobium sp. 39]MCK1752519.1 glycosyltransferase family 4 protein [Bradyrhizobium sp. 135]UPJ36738.1 glycosyltransferase family 4 protein [Bradyrhizobium sp. 4]
MVRADALEIVVVNDRGFPGGGASKVALKSAVGLAKLGHRVSVFAAMGPVAPELTEAGVDVRILGQEDLAGGGRLQMAAQGLWNVHAAKELAHLLAGKRKGRTVVHVHSWSKALSASIFAASAHSGHPVVATLHDYGFVCPNAALHDFPEGSACRRVPMSASCITRNCDARAYGHKLWRVSRQIALKNFAKAEDAISAAICVTDYSRSIMRPLLPARIEMVVVPNPIDVLDLGPATPETSRNFTYIGRFSREKGVLIAAEAAQLAGVPLTLVGDGELRSHVVSIAPTAIVTGWLPAEQVAAAIRASRAVIVPSLWRETQGMVVPEALSAGVPVIAATVTAPAAAILPGVDGLLFENGNAGALADALKRLATDDSLVRALGLAAYQRYWAAPATSDRHLSELEALYKRTIAKTGRLGQSETAPSSTF